MDIRSEIDVVEIVRSKNQFARVWLYRVSILLSIWCFKFFFDKCYHVAANCNTKFLILLTVACRYKTKFKNVSIYLHQKSVTLKVIVNCIKFSSIKCKITLKGRCLIYLCLSLYQCANS